MKKYLVYLGLLIVPAALTYTFWRKSELEKYPGYTITTTLKQYRTLKNGLQIEHFYFVNGEKFIERYGKDERLNIVYPNGRYLIRFSEKHPSVSEVLWKYPIPDSIKECPSSGWKQIPAFFLKNVD
ncbi:MAG: hypothetical protein ABL872_18250 [Lacibacter sp.]